MIEVSERVNEVNVNSRGSTMIIEEYNASDNVLVRFIETGNLTKTSYQNFKAGGVKNVYDKKIYGVGYFGEGNYKATFNGKPTKMYNTWIQMIHRCYSEKLQKKQPAYIGYSVAEEWFNYQTFAKWYDENFYKIEGETMELDKDILGKDSRIYSPETCIFVPKIINTLIKKRQDRELPTGVIMVNGKYQAHCYNTIEGINEFLGSYNTVEEAFQAYKTFKENVIKRVAESYKSRIPVTLYNALLTYEVEITD
jgi:hypothetical protein